MRLGHSIVRTTRRDYLLVARWQVSGVEWREWVVRGVWFELV